MHGWIEDIIIEVENLNYNTPDGQVIDADTILVDLIEENYYGFSGFAQDIFNIWRESTDKDSVEKMFYEFTNMEFVDFLMKCKNEITR